MGIDIFRYKLLAFTISSSYAGIAGAMLAYHLGAVTYEPYTITLSIQWLAMIIVGGLGSIPGAIIAGLLVGGFENVFQLYRGVTERDFYVMLLLFAFLVFRPGGLFAPKGGRN